MRNIVFIGLMGAGKTTVGKRLAKRHGLPFLDTDQAIERRCGASVSTIFDLEGEAGFRRREAKMISEAMALQDTVVTTGGGAILSEENRKALSQGFVIYLDAQPPVVTTVSWRAIASAIIFDSRRRKPASPSKSKMVETLAPQRRSIS